MKQLATRSGRTLALLSVGLGLAQLLFLRWAARVAIAGSAFLAYVGVIGFLIVRMDRRLTTMRPACPHCHAVLNGLSERVASATGKCDNCGESVIKPEDQHG